MKKSEIKVGGKYIAKVSNKLTTVKVDSIVEETRYAGKLGTYYNVTNLATGRKTAFRSAAKFRREAGDGPNTPVVNSNGSISWIPGQLGAK